MENLLKQSTIANKSFGPFISSVDGSEIVTGLTITPADVQVKRFNNAHEASTSTGDAQEFDLAIYDFVLSAYDTQTLGDLQVDIQMPGCLPIQRRFRVVTATQFNAQFLLSGATFIPDNTNIAAGATSAAAAAASAATAATQATAAASSAASADIKLDSLDTFPLHDASLVAFEAFFASNTGDKSIDDVTTPKNINFGVDD